MSPAQPDRPAFEVTVAGSALAPLAAADVVEIDVHEEIGRHGRCTLLVQNWDADHRAVRHSDDGPFTPGADLAVAIGYHSDLTPVFDGVIASLTAHFPAGGRPTLRVEARARSILLEYPPRSRQLADVNDADVASAIAADYSLTADADDGVKHAFVVSDRTSDWDFLKDRAGALGWAVYARGNSLVMHAPPAPEDPKDLDYTRDFVELHLTQDLTHAIGEATGAGWDVTGVEATESEQSASAAGMETGDRQAHDAAVADAGWPLRDARDASAAVAAADEADARAVARQRDAALAHLHGSAVIHGDPTVRCDAWVRVAGAGTRMSGPHYLTAVRHRLSIAGYTTELQMGRPPVLTPPAPRAAAGIAAGLDLGMVESLDDPDSAGRVKVRLPWRGDDGDGVWARVAASDAGDDYGTVFIPAVGQEVLIGYIDGDHATPVVLGQLYNGKAAMPVSIDPDKNTVRAIVTPGGHRLTFDDGDEPLISLVTAKGHSVVIDDKDESIVLTQEASGNSVTISAEGISLEAAKGDIVLKATAGAVKIDSKTFEGKASGPSKLESSATFDLKASGPLGLKGALVNIN